MTAVVVWHDAGKISDVATAPETDEAVGRGEPGWTTVTVEPGG